MAVKISNTRRINNLDRVKKHSLQEEHSQCMLQIEREKRSLMKDLESIQIRSGSFQNLSTSPPAYISDRRIPTEIVPDSIFSSNKTAENSLFFNRPSFSRTGSTVQRKISVESLSPTRRRKISLDSLVSQYSADSNSGEIIHQNSSLSSSLNGSFGSRTQNNHRQATLVRRAEKLEEGILRRRSFGSKGGYMYGEAAAKGRWEAVKVHKYHAAHRKPTAAFASHKSVS